MQLSGRSGADELTKSALDCRMDVLVVLGELKCSPRSLVLDHREPLLQ